jgi:hypothetical protein
MNTLLMKSLPVVLLTASATLPLQAKADAGSADEATWLTHLKAGAVANHWVGQSVDAHEESVSLTDTDMHNLMSALKLKKSPAPGSKYTTEGLRYMTEVGSKQVQIRVMYAF